MWEFFKFKETPYSFRSGKSLRLLPAETRSFGIKMVFYLGQVLHGTTYQNTLGACIQYRDSRVVLTH